MCDGKGSSLTLFRTGGNDLDGNKFKQKIVGGFTCKD